ncbi:MAG: hypothetical protein ACM3IJ_00590 [Candidatus Levyibacteriota bacterium]
MLYVLVKHDFVLARKSLLLQEIFDTTFIGYVVFFFVARAFYILGSLHLALFQPAAFFHIFRFPGLLFLGGVLGFAFFIWSVFMKKKILKRLMDIYSLSMFPLLFFALASSYQKGYFVFFNILIFVLACLFMAIGIYSYKNYVLKDGSTALLFLCLISIFTIVTEFSSSSKILFSLFTIPQIISVGIFTVTAIVLLIYEGIISSSKN